MSIAITTETPVSSEKNFEDGELSWYRVITKVSFVLNDQSYSLN